MIPAGGTEKEGDTKDKQRRRRCEWEQEEANDVNGEGWPMPDLQNEKEPLLPFSAPRPLFLDDSLDLHEEHLVNDGSPRYIPDTQWKVPFPVGCYRMRILQLCSPGRTIIIIIGKGKKNSVEYTYGS